ncbi:MAG: hypothetical protein IPK96_20270 [Flammeovirgaceae bacterium]|nr:hypothetical protein [Flammeovirgaceae bacterium]
MRNRFYFFSFGLLICLLLSGYVGYAQTDLKKFKEWKAKNISSITLDRLGDFFIINKNGTIKKYDPTGKQMASLSKASTTLVEPWYHPSIFTYSRQKQTYSLYGRNFENKVAYHIEPALAIEPFLVCPTHDNKLWILDKADWSLKKVIPGSSEVLQEFTISSEAINTDTEFTYLREYLNLIFLVDKNSGILVLNHLGQEIEIIPIKNLQQFYFFGEDLYYLENNQLKFFNLRTEETYQVDLPGKVVHALMTDEYILTINSQNQLTLYSYTMAP